MTAKELDNVRQRIFQEGFDYCFIHYSDFSEIKDEEFHKRRLAYAEAQEALWELLNMDEFEEM